jgi:hypothetical protein
VLPNTSLEHALRVGTLYSFRDTIQFPSPIGDCREGSYRVNPSIGRNAVLTLRGEVSGSAYQPARLYRLANQRQPSSRLFRTGNPAGPRSLMHSRGGPPRSIGARVFATDIVCKGCVSVLACEMSFSRGESPARLLHAGTGRNPGGQSNGTRIPTVPCQTGSE